MASRAAHTSAAYLLVFYLAYSLILKMLQGKSVCSSKMSVGFYWTTWRYIPKDSNLNLLTFPSVNVKLSASHVKTGKQYLIQWYFYLGSTKENILQALLKMPGTRLWGSRLKKFGIMKFVPNSPDDYQEERQIHEAVKDMSLGMRYY